MKKSALYSVIDELLRSTLQNHTPIRAAAKELPYIEITNGACLL